MPAPAPLTAHLANLVQQLLVGGGGLLAHVVALPEETDAVAVPLLHVAVHAVVAHVGLAAVEPGHVDGALVQVEVVPGERVLGGMAQQDGVGQGSTGPRVRSGGGTSGGRQAGGKRGGLPAHLWKFSPLSHFLFQWNCSAKAPQKPCTGEQKVLVE